MDTNQNQQYCYPKRLFLLQITSEKFSAEQGLLEADSET